MKTKYKIVFLVLGALVTGLWSLGAPPWGGRALAGVPFPARSTRDNCPVTSLGNNVIFPAETWPGTPAPSTYFQLTTTPVGFPGEAPEETDTLLRLGSNVGLFQDSAMPGIAMTMENNWWYQNKNIAEWYVSGWRGSPARSDYRYLYVSDDGICAGVSARCDSFAIVDSNQNPYITINTNNSGITLPIPNLNLSYNCPVGKTYNLSLGAADTNHNTGHAGIRLSPYTSQPAFVLLGATGNVNQGILAGTPNKLFLGFVDDLTLNGWTSFSTENFDSLTNGLRLQLVGSPGVATITTQFALKGYDSDAEGSTVNILSEIAAGEPYVDARTTRAGKVIGSAMTYPPYWGTTPQVWGIKADFIGGGIIKARIGDYLYGNEAVYYLTQVYDANYAPGNALRHRLGIFNDDPAYEVDVTGTLNANLLYQNGIPLGSMATQNANDVSITGGSVTGQSAVATQKLVINSNSRIGTATTSGSSMTVMTSAVTADSKIFLTPRANVGTFWYDNVVPGTSFDIHVSGDDIDIDWMIVEPK